MTHADLAQYITPTAEGDYRVWIVATLVRRDGTTTATGDWGDAELCQDCDGWETWLGCGVSDLLDALHLPPVLAHTIADAMNEALDEGRCEVTIPLDGALLVVQLVTPPEGTATVATGDPVTG